MGQSIVLSPKHLTTGRLTIDLDKDIHKLNIDKIPLLKMTDVIGKKSTEQMEYKHLYKERKSDWGGIAAGGIGGAWDAGANKAGTLTVTTGEGWMYGAGDIIKLPNDTDVNIYVDSVSGDVLTCHTYDDSTAIDLSAGTEGASNLILNVGNSFELGSGKGTMKSHQPTESTNYIQIHQSPFGIVETLDYVSYEAGGKELQEREQDAYIDHLFGLEKLMFFGQKHKATTGYMGAVYEQYFTGGAFEAITTNATTESDLTYAEFGNWVNDCLYYAEKPVIFAGATIFEGLSWWLGDRGLQTRQDEKTLGIAVSQYMNQYGDVVKVVPHRELFKNYYAGYAICIDLADVAYRFLQGADTHLEVGIQDVDAKQIINEYRTWFGFWMGNEKRHGELKGVSTISS